MTQVPEAEPADIEAMLDIYDAACRDARAQGCYDDDETHRAAIAAVMRTRLATLEAERDALAARVGELEGRVASWVVVALPDSAIGNSREDAIAKYEEMMGLVCFAHFEGEGAVRCVRIIAADLTLSRASDAECG